MKVQHLDKKDETVDVIGLLAMKPADRVGKIKLYHSRIIPVCDEEGVFTGRCKPLVGEKRALFAVLEGSDVRVGSMETEFLLGIRIDEPAEIKTTLICKCGCLTELGEPEIRYHGVRDFVQRIYNQGDLPEYHEVPKVLLDAMKRGPRL